MVARALSTTPAGRLPGALAWARGLGPSVAARTPAEPALGLFLTVLALLGFGLMVQVSHAATIQDAARFQRELLEQVGVRVLGVGALLAAARFGPSGVRRVLPHATLLAILFLVLVFVPGIGAPRNGSHRWLQLGPFGFQPSELARIVVVVWVANHCVLYGPRLADLRRAVLPILSFALVFFLLIYFEKDVGGAILLMLCVLSTLWVGGARTGHVGVFLTTGVGAALSYGLLTAPHVRHRLMTWVGQATNEQVSHTARAIGEGGFLGVGYTHGTARVQNVPHLESDFVLAQVGEELGWVGMAILLALFATFLWHALRLVLSLENRFEALATFGLCVSVALQAMVHVEVVAGLGPPKGMPLPFVSNGGSSLVVSCLAVGLALGAARNSGRRRRISAT